MSAQLTRHSMFQRFNLNPLPLAFSAAMFAAMPASVLTVGALLPDMAAAQSAYQTDADAPARVGRVAFVSGGVQFYSEAEPQWRAAQLNEPVTSRNSLMTDGGGRAEVRVGPTAFSLDANSQVDISQLDDQVFSSNLVRGSISVRMSHLENDDVVRVNTPNGQFELEKEGRYRIDADANSSRVTVFSGHAQAYGASGSVQVDVGKSLRVSNQGGGESFMFGAANSTDFDGWTLARDERYREGRSVQYVSRNMTGYEDLDANGRWASDPDYGPVWYPTTYISAEWAPYRYGRWSWVAPWGWTWVDDAPWGFAPFHYGRWVSIGGAWGWTPGAYVARPVFAPALVGFYGGSNFSVSFSAGPAAALGWYPLAPWERYSPAYTRNVTYINRVNNIRVINPPARYVDRADFNRMHGGTVIRQADFGNRREVSRLAARNIPDDVIRRAPALAPPQHVGPPRSASFRSVQANGVPDFNQQPGPSQFTRERRPDFDQERERQRERMGDRSDERGNNRQEWARPNPPAVLAPQAPQQLPDPRPDGRSTSRFNRDSQDNSRFEQRRQQQQEQVQPPPQFQRDEQQGQRREFERRQGARMEQQRVEQPRADAPRPERPAALNVPQPPPQMQPQTQPQPQAAPEPAPSRFNQQPQEARNENQDNRENRGRGGSRFRPPDQQ